VEATGFSVLYEALGGTAWVFITAAIIMLIASYILVCILLPIYVWSINKKLDKHLELQEKMLTIFYSRLPKPQKASLEEKEWKF
jgi:hypothetical protein